MFWPWKGHILAISRKRGLWDTPRNMKFGMEHPWAHWLWFRKNQFEGPCEDHVLAIKGIHPEFWNLTWSILGHIDYDSGRTILRTTWGPCFGHKRAMFWPFLGKGDTGYTQQCEIWHGTSLGTLLRIQKEPIWRTMFRSKKEPYFGHFLEKGIEIYPAI